MCELRYKVDLVKFAGSVEGGPVWLWEYSEGLFHQDSIVLSKRWNRDIFVEINFHLVIVCEFPEEFEPAVCGKGMKACVVPVQKVPF